jgi:hypothetical protein
MRLVLALLVVAACGGDDTMMMPADGGGDSNDGDIVSLEIAVDFARIPTTIASPITEHVRGPDGRIFGLRAGTLVASSDAGATFSVVAASNGTYLAATTASLFALGQGPLTLARSTGGALTALTAPASATFLAATPTTLWILSLINNGVDAPKLYRSTDQGDNFTEITPPPPPPNNRWNLYTGGEYLFLESNGRIYRTQTGASWDDLGTIPMLRSFAATQAGTALALGTPTNYALYRRAIGDTAWTPSADLFAVYQISQRENGELVRINTGAGSIELSTNDGTSWTAGPGASLTSCSVLEHQAFDTAILGSCFDSATTLNIRLPAAAAQWIREEPAGLPFPQYANYTDVSFSDDGKIALAGKRRIYLSDDGVTWRASTYAADSTWPINSVAITPDGERIFAGSTVGRYAFLDTNGAVTSTSNLPVPPAQHVRQADWVTDQVVIVTTASDSNTEGGVFDGNPDRVGTWMPINPFAREDNPQFDPMAGFHGVEACAYAGSHAYVFGVHQWFGTNSYQTRLRIRYQHGDPFADLEPPVSPFIASSLSCSPSGLRSSTFGDEFLYVGDFLVARFRRVMPTGMEGKLIVAKLAPDDRLWVVTDRGVFRSTQPIVLP